MSSSERLNAATAITTFWYELDRSACKAKFRRSRESYLEKLVQILDNASKNPMLSVMAFVESKNVKLEILSLLKVPETSMLASRIIVKPLKSWEKVQKYNKEISDVLTTWNGSKETPETFDSLYVCLNLSKIDAVLIHGAELDAKHHIWIDGGYRWDTSSLKDFRPQWSEVLRDERVYFSESKPFDLMGGVFGGSLAALKNFRIDMDEQIAIEITKRKPFTDQTVYRAIARKYPLKVSRVPIYSKALIGNFVFGSALLDKMLPAVLNAAIWERHRPLLAKSEIIILFLLSLICISIAVLKNLKT